MACEGASCVGVRSKEERRKISSGGPRAMKGPLDGEKGGDVNRTSA